ncbi:MAG: hypothetical protein LC808_22980 [Actinobacteria bacterium]|nr:hypothetical protein [Actinomycetota bacterium]
MSALDERWIWSLVAILGGLGVGVFGGVFVRRFLDREDRRSEVRHIAGPAGLFVFWLATASGIVLAIAVSSPETLRPIPRDILEWLPRVGVAGLFLLAGYAVGVGLATAIGRTAGRISGRRQRGVERAVRSAVFAAAAILALGAVGVDTTILSILVAAGAFGFAMALAGIAVIGTRDVAGHIAAGRTLQASLPPGARIRTTELCGTVVERQVTHVVIEGADGARRLVPWATLLNEVITVEYPDDGS